MSGLVRVRAGLMLRGSKGFTGSKSFVSERNPISLPNPETPYGYDNPGKLTGCHCMRQVALRPESENQAQGYFGHC